MPKPKKIEEEAPEFDLIKLPEDGEHDPTDVFTHHFVEVSPWHAIPGMVGEIRVLKCDGPDCTNMLPITDTRVPDPDNPLPVSDPFDPPKHNADYDGT